MTKPLDRRLHAFRPDLADETLKGSVEAGQFVRGEPARIAVSVAQLRPAPDLARGVDTELLWGETVRVFDRADGFAWVQADQDGYVGYLPETMLAGPDEPTHRIAVPRTFLYPEAELRKPPVAALSMGSRITVVGEAETRGTRYFILANGGAVIARHCLPIAETLGDDYVAVAGKFIETPYLWGGRSGFGLDCSSLVQLALMMTGQSAPRDSDMQASLGKEITRMELRRGDLVFWEGHVGIMENAETLLHANGHTMSVARENFAAAVERIGWLYQQPTGYRRLDNRR
ncbi:cell wall-associated NlpC family hydrolase [Neorhizobium sp. 2083]|uniref:C40 family peptidase n=1 Tax=Neorhizobium sp. 2083 TaxID=2817762 RepID=UPI00285A28D5|nr:NlpC/P60 family protein [Neorhizobium sp. 2083]MDR6816121.1 cell wall-associated NlpC family hydrolase [Neorhizobium sp. 2083]